MIVIKEIFNSVDKQNVFACIIFEDPHVYGVYGIWSLHLYVTFCWSSPIFNAAGIFLWSLLVITLHNPGWSAVYKLKSVNVQSGLTAAGQSCHQLIITQLFTHSHHVWSMWLFHQFLAHVNELESDELASLVRFLQVEMWKFVNSDLRVMDVVM